MKKRKKMRKLKVKTTFDQALKVLVQPKKEK